LAAAFAYVVLLTIIALGVPLALSLGARVNAEVRSQAQGEADIVAATAADLLAPARRGELDALARLAASSVRGRVIVVDRAGTAVADSSGPAFVGTSYANRPEIARALRGRAVQIQRPSRTLGEEILATAVPIFRARATVGAVRITQSVAAVHSAVRRIELGLALIGLVVLALGSIVGAIIARRISRPLDRLERVARRVSGGDLGARAPIEGSREQRSLGESFNEMTDRVARLLDAQRAFVADASHQLRTPLTGLRLRLEEARAASVGEAAAAELDAGVAEVDRLAQIVEELLVLGRAGERELPGEPLDLREVAAGALERWRAPAAEHGIALEREDGRPPDRGGGEVGVGAADGVRTGAGARDGAGTGAGAAGGGGSRPPTRDGARVWCARADADRALDALVENALRYSPRDSTVTLASADGRIEVRDRGPGIAAGEGEAIFERFHRGSAGRLVPAGSGLGLNIARELARGWGGDVTIANRSGGGAVAVLSLPPERGA
jgi:two-component system, OmpR family, sensor kinase